MSPVSAKRGDLKVRTLPPKMVQALAPFAPLFSKRVWQHAQVLFAGARIAPGKEGGRASRASGCHPTFADALIFAGCLRRATR